MLLEERMDATTTHILLPELLALVDSCHNFEMMTHTYFDKKSYVSFTVNKITQANIRDQALCGQAKRTRVEDEPMDVSSNPKKLCTNEMLYNVVGVGAEDTMARPDRNVINNKVTLCSPET